MKSAENTPPRHVEFICDGNRRFARKNNLTHEKAYEIAVDRIGEIATAAQNSGVDYSSFFILSRKNFENREKSDIEFLTKTLFSGKFREMNEQLLAQNSRIKFIGDGRNFVDEKTRKNIEEIEKTSRENSGMNVIYEFGYDGQQEIFHSVDEMFYRVKALRLMGVDAGQFLRDDFEFGLERGPENEKIPDVDMLIRTGGNQRLSGSQIWRDANAELFFTNKYWPEFTAEDFAKMLEKFAKIKRNFGR